MRTDRRFLRAGLCFGLLILLTGFPDHKAAPSAAYILADITPHELREHDILIA